MASIQHDSSVVAHRSVTIDQALQQNKFIALCDAGTTARRAAPTQMQHRGLSHLHRQSFLDLQQQLLVSWLRGGLPSLRLAARIMPNELQQTLLVIRPGAVGHNLLA